MLTRIILGLLAITTFTACSPGSAGTARPLVTQPPGSNVAPSAGPSTLGSSIDQAFIDMMVPHHQSAVEMAKLAQERAEHEELRDLADDIIAAQEREISQMKAWRAEWFGSDQTPPMDQMPILPGVDMPGMPDHGMGVPTMDMTAEIEMLRDAEPFDAAFIEAMVAHHRSAIDAAGVVLAQTQRSEIRGLAEDIIESQQTEMDQMESWRAEWYPGAT